MDEFSAKTIINDVAFHIFLVSRKPIRPQTSDVREHNVYNNECECGQSEIEWALRSSAIYFFQIGYLPIVIYVPALAFNQVTGVDVHIITPIVCVICVFYTSVGGIKAVVWTDVVQIFSMFGALLLVAVKGSYDLGGMGVVFQKAIDTERIEPPELVFM